MLDHQSSGCIIEPTLISVVLCWDHVSPNHQFFLGSPWPALNTHARKGAQTPSFPLIYSDVLTRSRPWARSSLTSISTTRSTTSKPTPDMTPMPPCRATGIHTHTRWEGVQVIWMGGRGKLCHWEGYRGVWMGERGKRCHCMETFSALLVLCEGNPPVTGGFPSQRASNIEPWCFLCC